jgi:hypothetical protein
MRKPADCTVCRDLSADVAGEIGLFKASNAIAYAVATKIVRWKLQLRLRVHGVNMHVVCCISEFAREIRGQLTSLVSLLRSQLMAMLHVGVSGCAPDMCLLRLWQPISMMHAERLFEQQQAKEMSRTLLACERSNTWHITLRIVRIRMRSAESCHWSTSAISHSCSWLGPPQAAWLQSLHK